MLSCKLSSFDFQLVTDERAASSSDSHRQGVVVLLSVCQLDIGGPEAAFLSFRETLFGHFGSVLSVYVYLLWVALVTDSEEVGHGRRVRDGQLQLVFQNSEIWEWRDVQRRAIQDPPEVLQHSTRSFSASVPSVHSHLNLQSSQSHWQIERMKKLGSLKETFEDSS